MKRGVKNPNERDAVLQLKNLAPAENVCSA